MPPEEVAFSKHVEDYIVLVELVSLIQLYCTPGFWDLGLYVYIH